MIIHIVMLAFKDENKTENLQKIKTRLDALLDKVPSLKSMEVGLDFMQSDRSFDLVLTSSFDDKAGLSEYAVHPAHLDVVKLIKEVTVEAKVVDYVK